MNKIRNTYISRSITCFLWSFFMSVGVLSLNSCDSNIPDNDFPSKVGTEEVTLSVIFNPGIETRADEPLDPADNPASNENVLKKDLCEICWGTEINKIYYKAFEIDSDGKLKDDNSIPSSVTVEKLEGTKIKLTLDRSKKYRLLFWAQHDKEENEVFESPYTLSSLMEVTVDYSKSFNNDERLDAFYGSIDYDWANGKTPDNVTLHRPFAQVNVGSIIADWLPSGFYDKKNVKSEMKISKVATKFYINSGKVSENSYEENITFELNNIFDGPTQDIEYLDPEDREALSFPRGFLYVDFNENGKIDQSPASDKSDNPVSSQDAGSLGTDVDWWRYERSRYISMAYFLVANTDKLKDAKDVIDVKFSIQCTTKDEEDKEETFSYEMITFDNVSVKANYRTNIVGSLFTKQQRIYVNLSPLFDGKYEDTDSDDKFPLP